MMNNKKSKLLICAVLSVLIASTVITIANTDDSEAINTSYAEFSEGEYKVLTASGSPTQYISITSGVLPPGIGAYNGPEYGIRGTPTKPGVFTVGIEVVGLDGSGYPTGAISNYVMTMIVKEKVTYHNADGTTTVSWYSPYYPHYAPTGTAASGQTFCGWNTASDGSGITYLENSIVPFGIKDLYAQQSSSPVKLTLTHSFSGSAAFVRNVIYDQPVMLPVSTDPKNYSTASSIKAEIGWNTASSGTGDMYLIGAPAQFTANKTLYGQKATTDSSRTVVIVGMAAYYVPRGETFEFSYAGVPTAGAYSSSFPPSYMAPFISGTSEVVNIGYTMTANANVIQVIQNSNTGTGPIAVSVTYIANGGTGTMPNVSTGTNATGVTLFSTKAQQCAFTPPAGKMFKTWHIGSLTGPTISPGGVINGGGTNINLYAEWMDIPPDPVWTVTYDANGGTGTITPSTVVQGQPYTVTSQMFTPPNQRSFVGWGVQGTPTVYDQGDTFTPTGDITLVAIWQWDFFFVNLIPNGAPGDTVNLTSPGDESFIMPSCPFTWSGHVFTGWQVNNSEPTLSVGYEFWPQANINLYAQWIDTSNPMLPGFELTPEWIAIIGLAIFCFVLLMLVVMVMRDD